MSDELAGFPPVYDGPAFGEDVAEAPSDLTEDSAPAFDSGQGEETVTPDTTSGPESFDLDAYGNQVVTIKVDGEELQVPVAELRNGYMRQAAFTKRTQELSYANTLAEALRSDPQGTLAYLQSQYGGQPVANVQEDQWPEDPVERRLAEIQAQYEARLAPIEEQAARSHLENVLGSLQSQYGDDFEPKAVVAEAVRRGITDPRMLEPIYKEMAFDRMRQAREQVSAQQKAENAKREQAKSQIVNHTNGSFASAATNTSPPKNFREAAERAAAEQGITLNW